MFKPRSKKKSDFSKPNMFFTSSCVDMFLSMFLQWGVLSLSLYIYIYTNVGSPPWTVIRTRWSRVVNTSCENSHCCQDASLHQKTKKWFVKTEYVIYIELCWSVLIHDSALVALSLFLSLSMYICIYISYICIYMHIHIYDIYILFNCCAAIHNQFLNMHRDICNHCPPGMSDSSRSEIGVCSEHGSLSGSSDTD